MEILELTLVDLLSGRDLNVPIRYILIVIKCTFMNLRQSSKLFFWVYYSRCSGPICAREVQWRLEQPKEKKARTMARMRLMRVLWQ